MMRDNRFFVLSVCGCLCFFILGGGNILGQQPTGGIGAEKKIEKVSETLNRILQNLETLKMGQSNLDWQRNVSELTEKLYEKNHRNSDSILKNAQWALGIFGGFFVIFTIIVSWNIHKKVKIEIKSIREKFNDELRQIELEINQKIKAGQARTFYNIAVSNINDKNKENKYEYALEFLTPLYKSRYRIMDVCYHLGTCYKNLGQLEDAKKYFEEAKVAAENTGKDSWINKIQREIDEVKSELEKDLE